MAAGDLYISSTDLMYLNVFSLFFPLPPKRLELEVVLLFPAPLLPELEAPPAGKVPPDVTEEVEPLEISYSLEDRDTKNDIKTH